MELLIILAVAVGGMYLLTGKQRKQQKEAASFRANLAPGQYVMTGSGLFGTIVAVDDDAVVLETSPGVTSRWLRPAVAKLAELPVPAEDEDAVDELEEAYEADAYDDEAYDETDEAYEDEELANEELADEELDEELADEALDEEPAEEELVDEDADEPALAEGDAADTPEPDEDAPRR